MIDILDAKYVEILTDSTGKLWINVNEQCQLRIGKIATLQLNIGPDQYISLTKNGRHIVNRHQSGEGITCWCGKNHFRNQQIKQARPFTSCPKN